MLRFVIAVSNFGNTAPLVAEIEIRPLNARSLALSALLGTHPPQLPARALVALGELFGIAAGTMRTALSRLVAAGDLESDDGRYRLAGDLLDRQRTQDAGRRSPDRRWDGRWHTAISTDDQRPVGERRRSRRILGDARFGELRPDTWMRPANTPAPDAGPGWVVVTGELDADRHAELVDRLWDLDRIAGHADQLRGHLAESNAAVGSRSPAPFDTIPDRFHTAAAVLRFLRSEPLLPGALVGPDWSVDALRSDYAVAEAALQATLRTFFREA